MLELNDDTPYSDMPLEDLVRLYVSIQGDMVTDASAYAIHAEICKRLKVGHYEFDSHFDLFVGYHIGFPITDKVRKEMLAVALRNVHKRLAEIHK